MKTNRILSGLLLGGLVILVGCGKSDPEKDTVPKVEKSENTAETETPKTEVLAGKLTSDAATLEGATILGLFETVQSESVVASDGAFLLSVPKEGEKLQHVIAWTSDLTHVGEKAIEEGGDAKDLALTLEKADSIPGTVKDLDTGEPVADANVMFWFRDPADPSGSSLAFSDSEGKVALPAVRKTRMFVRATLGERSSRAVEVAPGHSVELLLAAEPAPQVRFRDPAGAVEFPLVVSLESPAGDVMYVETDEKGILDLLGSPRGEMYIVDFPTIDSVAEPRILQTWNESEILIVPAQ